MSLDPSRARLQRALLHARDARAALAVARGARDSCDRALVDALFSRFATELHRSPRHAHAAVRALGAVARVSGAPDCRALAAFAVGALAHVEGRHGGARAGLRQAAAWHARADSALGEGDAWRALIEVEKEAGDHAAALAAFRRARACYLRAPCARGTWLGGLLMNLGNAHHHADRHSDALKAYEQARPHLVRAGDAVRVAACDYNRANILATLDRVAEARSLAEDALEAFRAGRRDALAAQAEYACAGLDVLEGRLDAGLQRLHEARRSQEALGDVPGMAHSDLDAAEALLRLNRPAEADALARRARAHFRRSRQADEVAACDVVRAGAALQEGRPRPAARLFRAAAHARRRSGNVVAAALAETGLAAAELASGRGPAAKRVASAAARALLGRGLRSRAARAFAIAADAALTSGDAVAARRMALRARDMARRRDPRVEMAALLVLARREERAGRRDSAHLLLRAAADLVERMRLGVTSEESLLAFALDKSDVFEALVANRLAVGTREATREALQYAERGKARSLAEHLARGASGRGVRTPATRAALRRLEDVERRLAVAESRLQGDGGTHGLRSRRESEAARLIGERAGILRDLGRQAPRQALVAGATAADPWAGIAALAPGEIALEYAVSGGDFHLFLIDAGRVEAFPAVARVDAVRDVVDLLRFQLGKGVLGEDHAARHAPFLESASRRRLEQLHDLLLGPVADRLDGRSVRIVPHGLLHGLPFHALEHRGRALVERAVVAYAPSLAVLGLLAGPRRRTAAAPLVLGVADSAAPEIEEEVTAVQRHLADARVFRGEAATRDALRLSEDGPSLLHVACHGLFIEGVESPGALRLGDAWLSLPDLQALRGTGSLVVLSGCETGRGVVHSGDEWVGLVRGFLLAGARCVVASAWPVHDRSTVTLMDDFYAELGAGASVGEALSLAQRAARRRGAPLLHWAPFLAVGDPWLRLPARQVA